jgi:hypothetical protein
MTKRFWMADPGYEMIAEYPLEYEADGETKTVDLLRLTTVVNVDGRMAYCKTEYSPAMVRQAREFGRYAYSDAKKSFRATIGPDFTLPTTLHWTTFQSVAQEVLRD